MEKGLSASLPTRGVGFQFAIERPSNGWGLCYDRPVRLPAPIACLLAAVLGLAGAAPSPAAESPVLARLEYSQDGEIKTAPIRLAGRPAPFPARSHAQPSWRLRPGATLDGDQPPAERQIELYYFAGTGAVEALCVVHVRYFPAKGGGGWVPAYRLDETPLVRRDPATGRFVPLLMLQGAPAMVQLLGSTLPNAEGYYPQLEIALSTGPVAIDSWTVR